LVFRIASSARGGKEQSALSATPEKPHPKT
jgi:hypothetical protein